MLKDCESLKFWVVNSLKKKLLFYFQTKEESLLSFPEVAPCNGLKSLYSREVPLYYVFAKGSFFKDSLWVTGVGILASILVALNRSSQPGSRYLKSSFWFQGVMMDMDSTQVVGGGSH